jgi:transcription antitermination factor NusG
VDTIQSRSLAAQQRGWQSPFKPNDRVIIERGPFAGLEAVFDGSLSASGRVRVLLGTIARLVPVELDVGMLRPAV